MVLQDLDNAPPSDGYGDESSQNSHDPSGHRFDPSQLPQPIPIIAPLLGFSETVTRYKTEQTIKYAEKRIRRPMTPSESRALATHLFKMEQTKSYFAAVGAAGGVYRWYNTRGTNRYPFYKPKPEDVNPNKFMFIKGPWAQSARQIWRISLYTIVATEMGKLIGQIVAQPLAAKDTTQDPALERFSQDLKSAMANDTRIGRDIKGDTPAEWERQRQARAGELPPHAGAPKPWGWSSQQAGPKPARSSQADDDMSPTAGSEDGWSSTTSNPYGDSNFSSNDAEVSSQNAEDTRQRESQNTWNRQSRRTADEDDESPTGGLFQEDVQNQNQNQNQPKLGESTWERLRRGGGPPAGQRSLPRRPEPSHREQREGSTLGDSFTFAETDDERRLAQEKAQREFDQRIEKERQGKDFNEGNEKRW
ncbi:hypothetical protein B0J11DRAFT_553573 [Dendryphion nanum]|uniref:Uncharacterized protein n=1 Tax=Dendryphion nanum TaxID=256645 RepID=A0A9P9IBV4_9PLEO|nr:hypothetical protein B0J11DRAFT_553573 [Dendryphion nanum]